ncbi:helix-turn-helix domain-containing protein [Acinetobacter baumannii]|jgi:AraC-like DNA-binding protein|uniref:helix-turn-helix domain-containing protein n=1 Tax=Acinetobacter baumannii TaxID=470 RepID=UPI003799C03C|nr:helix-turn-helix transcriptional regulator [Acinetobacter baumannii]
MEILFEEFENINLSKDNNKHYKSCVWDEIIAWSDEMYMPFHVTPISNQIKPSAQMDSTQISNMILTKFTYGIPICANEWNTDTEKLILFTTIKGSSNHVLNGNSAVMNSVGESCLVDFYSNENYTASVSENHLLYNITILFNDLDQFMLKNYGFNIPNKLREYKTTFGGKKSSWMTLLQYIVNTLQNSPAGIFHNRIEKQMEEMIALHILDEWSTRAGIRFEKERSINPRVVRNAETYIRENLNDAPTLLEVAQAVGVSSRTLADHFKKQHQQTIGQYSKELRLDEVRKQLLTTTNFIYNISDIAYNCGFNHLGAFAKDYKNKFNELPSETIKRR